MANLRKLLNERSIIRRNRRVLLNIQITIVAWSLEFVGSIFGALMFWMPFENQTSRIFQLMTSAIYFVMIPSIYLVNGDDTKSKIMESKIYLVFTDTFFSRTVHHIEPPPKNNDNNPNGDLGDGEQIM